jgi:hypothetical protein
MSKTHRNLRYAGTRVIGLFSIIFLLSELGASKAAASDQDGPVRPIEPRALLSLLPTTVENWKLTASRGREMQTDLATLESFGFREFLFVPPPPPPGQPPAPNKTVQITLFDTGLDPSLLVGFKSFRMDESSSPSGAKSPFTCFMVGSFRAMQSQRGPTMVVSVEVSKRFLLIVNLTNVDQKGRDQWLKFLDIPHLAQASAAAPKNPLVSGNISMENVNEIDPSQNSVSTLNYMTTADIIKVDKEISDGKR